MAGLPSGTVTFLFTDIEGSTTRWEHQPDAMRAALARHDAVLRAAIQTHNGHVVKTMGDAFHAAFSRAPDAVAEALDAQRRLQAESWGEIGPLRVRMALHTGAAEERDGDYYGPPLNRAARLLSTGHAGQILLSEATTALVREALPSGASLLDLGQHRLKDLTEPEQVAQLTAPDLPLDFAPLASLDTRTQNLPIHPTVLLGREREVAGIRAVLRDGVRLVTLTGPGGVGKTRLGVQVAAELLDDFDHGVFVVELAPVVDPTLVPLTIAQVLGVRDLGKRTVVEGLKEHLRSRKLLLVLDNFEQILTAAPVVVDLLATSPDVKVLVTSREPLRLRGEQEYAVLPLALPDLHNLPPADTLSGYAAVALFVERAAAIRADFAMTDKNASAIAEICARLDGLPLAIELAAARVRLLTPQMMVDRLERRLLLLTGGARDLPDRQQTLRNTIDWSHDLLDEHERRLFRRLSAFVGGWTVEAAEAVCNLGDPRDLDIEFLDGLESLISKNLIRRAEGSSGDARFGMLETIREYALERLEESGEEARVRQRHAGYYLAVAERAEPELRRAAQGVWLDRLEADHDNFRLALRWVVKRNEAELGLRLGGALSHFWEMRGRQTEGRAHLAEVLHLAGTREYPRLRAKMLCELGFLAADQGDNAEARALQGESLTIRRELGDQRGVARCLIGLGWIATNEGDYATGHARHWECLAIMREVGDRRGISQALSGLGFVAYVHGDHARARAYHEESLMIAREVGDPRSVGRSLTHLGALAIELQDHTGARVWLAEGLAITYALGDVLQLIDELEVFASLELACGSMERAARLQGAAEALRETIGAPLSASNRRIYDVEVATVRAALGEVAFAAAWAAGRAMSQRQAVAYAQEASGSA